MQRMYDERKEQKETARLSDAVFDILYELSLTRVVSKDASF